MGKTILEISTLNIDNITIFVCTDLSTRELYFYENKNGIMIPLPKEICAKAQKKIFSKSELPPIIEELLKSIIKEYLEKNDNNSSDNTNLNRNWDNICIVYETSNLNEATANYEAINNVITISLPKELLELCRFSLKINELLYVIIAHEIGHMVVSELKIENNYLIGTTGFLKKKYALEDCILTSDGNYYYRVNPNIEPQTNDGQGLEELFNVLETDLIANTSNAQGFAHDLDYLTDRKLRSARQNHSLETYYDLMKEIIPDENTARLLLIAINLYYDSLNKNDQELTNEINDIINKIINEYQIAKDKLPKSTKL